MFSKGFNDGYQGINNPPPTQSSDYSGYINDRAAGERKRNEEKRGNDGLPGGISLYGIAVIIDILVSAYICYRYSFWIGVIVAVLGCVLIDYASRKFEKMKEKNLPPSKAMQLIFVAVVIIFFIIYGIHSIK